MNTVYATFQKTNKKGKTHEHFIIIRTSLGSSETERPFVEQALKDRLKFEVPSVHKHYKLVSTRFN
jgi:hypothetical protein